MEEPQGISLQPYNTFGIDIQANHFFRFTGVTHLREILEYGYQDNPLILGGGSNILLTGQLNRPVLKNEIRGIEMIDENEKHVYIRVGGGESWHDLVAWAVSRGLGGIENLALIPGTVGAAPMQNIGAYGVEIKDVFEELQALRIDTGFVKTFTAREIGFGYRWSIFKGTLKNQYVIVYVTLKLDKTPELKLQYGAIKQELSERKISSPQVKDIFDIIIDIRQSKLPDPSKVGNSGSFFKNPIISRSQLEQIQLTYPKAPYYQVDSDQVKIPAGWLIEELGWKGHRRGAIGVYPNHALVLVNWGGGTGSQIWQLAQDIQASVLEQFGIQLEPEVNII